MPTSRIFEGHVRAAYGHFWSIPGSRIMKNLVNFLDDLLLLAGGSCIVYGLSMWSIPAAWVFAGAFMIGFGVLIGKVKAKYAIT